jgi:hypothetical protein
MLILALAALSPFQNAHEFLKTWCAACHQGPSPAAGFHLERLIDKRSLHSETRRWTTAAGRVRAGEMPPKGAPAPSLSDREKFHEWVEQALQQEACAAGPAPGPAVTRRLNRDEYSNTIRDLFDMHLDLARLLPEDGAGGEGFDNAAETLFLSPLHSEKYLEAAKLVTDFAGREFKPRAKVFVARPGPGKPAHRAAEEILRGLLPRAFRRPVSEADVAPYTALFRAAVKEGQDFEAAVLTAVRAVLVSPMFLYRFEPPNPGPGARPLNHYALASRLSYFLWGSMPDELLFDVAASGKITDPEVMKYLVRRMLRNDRSFGFAKSFVEQWLHTRALEAEKAPDATLFPTYAASEDLRGDIRLQPVLFFQEVLMRNQPVLDFLDSTHTVATGQLERHFGLKLPLNPGARQQPQWVELPKGTNRGGVLGMPAVLAVSSYPYRTSPVLRGAWILESILGTPSPPPPPDVPALEEPPPEAAPSTVRERLERHRANAACASCHSRIDGLGFALENYDVIGRWRDQDGGKPIDNSGELADGARFQGPDELRRVLLDRKDLFVRNLTRKLLGYALGRGLTLTDACTVDAIVAELRENNYSAWTLIESIVMSAPFQQQAATPVPPREGKKP